MPSPVMLKNQVLAKIREMAKENQSSSAKPVAQPEPTKQIKTSSSTQSSVNPAIYNLLPSNLKKLLAKHTPPPKTTVVPPMAKGAIGAGSSGSAGISKPSTGGGGGSSAPTSSSKPAPTVIPHDFIGPIQPGANVVRAPAPTETKSTSTPTVVSPILQQIFKKRGGIPNFIPTTPVVPSKPSEATPHYVSPAAQKLSERMPDVLENKMGSALFERLDTAYINRQTEIYNEKKAEIDRLSKAYQSETDDNRKKQIMGALSNVMMQAESAGAKAGITEKISVSLDTPLSSIVDRLKTSPLSNKFKGTFERLEDRFDKVITPKERDLNIQLRKISDMEMATGSVRSTDWQKAEENRQQIQDNIDLVSSQSKDSKWTINGKTYSQSQTINMLQDQLDSIKVTYGDKEYVPGIISYDTFKEEVTKNYREGIASSLQKPEGVSQSDWDSIVARYKAREIGITGVNDALIEASIPPLPEVYAQNGIDVLGIEPEYRKIMRKTISGQITQDEAETLLTSEFNRHLAIANENTLSSWGQGKKIYLKPSLQEDINNYEIKYNKKIDTSKGIGVGPSAVSSQRIPAGMSTAQGKIDGAKKWLEENPTPEEYSEKVISEYGEGAFVDWENYKQQHPDSRALKLKIDDKGKNLGEIFIPTLDYKMAEEQEFDELKGVGPDISVLDIASLVFPPAGLVKSSMNLAGIKDTSPSLSAGQWSKAFVVGATQFPKTIYTLASAIPPALESGDYWKEYNAQLQPSLYEAGYGIRKAVDVGHKTGDWKPYLTEMATSPAMTDVVYPLAIGAGFSAAAPLISGAGGALGGRVASGAGRLASKFVTKAPPKLITALTKAGVTTTNIGRVATVGGRLLGKTIGTPYGMTTLFMAPSAVEMGAQTALYHKGAISRQEWIASLQQGARTGFQLGMFSAGATYKPSGAFTRFAKKTGSSIKTGFTKLKHAVKHPRGYTTTFGKPGSEYYSITERFSPFGKRTVLSENIPAPKGVAGVKTQTTLEQYSMKTGGEPGWAPKSKFLFKKPTVQTQLFKGSLKPKVPKEFRLASERIIQKPTIQTTLGGKKVVFVDKGTNIYEPYTSGKWTRPENIRIMPRATDTMQFTTKDGTYFVTTGLDSRASGKIIPLDKGISSKVIFTGKGGGSVRHSFVGGGKKYLIKGKSSQKIYADEGPLATIPSIRNRQFRSVVTSEDLGSIGSDITKTSSTGSYYEYTPKKLRSPSGKITTQSSFVDYGMEPTKYYKSPFDLFARHTKTGPSITFSKQMGGETSVPGKFGLTTVKTPEFTYSISKSPSVKDKGFGFILKGEDKGVGMAMGGGGGGGSVSTKPPDFVLPGGGGSQISLSKVQFPSNLSQYPSVGVHSTPTSLAQLEALEAGIIPSNYWRGTVPIGPSLTGSKLVSTGVTTTIAGTKLLSGVKLGLSYATMSGLRTKSALSQKSLNKLTQVQMSNQALSQQQSQIQEQSQLQQQQQAQMQQQAQLQATMLYTPQVVSPVVDTKVDYAMKIVTPTITTPRVELKTPKPKAKFRLLPGDEEKKEKEKQRRLYRPYSIGYKEKMHEVPKIWKQATTKKQWTQKPISKKPNYIKLT